MPPWARALDVLLPILFITVIVIAVTGGIRTSIFGVRLTVTSPIRIFVWAVILALVRHWRIPPHPLLRRLRPTAPDDERFFRDRGAPADHRVWQTAAVAAGGVVITLAITWPQAARMHSIPDIGDPLLSTWRNAWVAHQMVRDPLHLFDANIFYPERRALAFSDATIVPGLMAAPLLAAGANPVVAYNIILLATFFLATLFTFLFVRRLVGDTAAAIVAAVIFGFYPFRFEHYSHLELLMSFWIPLGLWAFHRTVKRGMVRDGLLTGLAIAGQTLSSMYYGLFFVTYLIPVTIVLWWTGSVAAGAKRALAAGAVVTAIVVAPAAVPYLQNRAVVGERQFSEIYFYSATPKDYVSAHPISATWGRMLGTNLPERHLFPGVIVLALAIAGLWPPYSKLRVAYAAALAFVFDLSLGFHGIFYGSLYDYVLPYRGLRVPARISIFVGFSLALFAAWGVRRITAHLPAGLPRVVIPMVLAAGILLEDRPLINLEPIWRQPPAVYDQIEPAAVIAELPPPSKDNIAWFDTRYMYFSTFHWRRLLNGNGGFLPPSYQMFVDQMQSFPSRESLAYLKTRNVDYVLVHGAFMEPDAYSAMRETLDKIPDVSLVRRFVWENREGSVYRLRR